MESNRGWAEYLYIYTRPSLDTLYALDFENLPAK